MKTITLRPAEPERDFGQIAALFALEQGEPESETSLRADYEAQKDRLIHFMVAEDERGKLLGFDWTARNRNDLENVHFYVIVKPEQRGQGTGRRLYADLEQAAQKAHIHRLQISIRDSQPEFRAFAERRGFIERSHSMGLALDLTAFDDRPYAEVVARLKGEGFRFTSMEELGNNEEAQHNLYSLNDTTAMEMPGSDGQHAWPTFEDFQKSVCQRLWYMPGGQIIAIDKASGRWAAMSAITRLEGNDYAYNLHTGVDKLYRGRQLEQAVLALALRYARDVLKAASAHTDETPLNLSMLAVYRELGYKQIEGTFSMVKTLE